MTQPARTIEFTKQMTDASPSAVAKLVAEAIRSAGQDPREFHYEYDITPYARTTDGKVRSWNVAVYARSERSQGPTQRARYDRSASDGLR